MDNAIGIIRPFTPADEVALNASALRFAKRHDLRLPLWKGDRSGTGKAWCSLEAELWCYPGNPYQQKRLTRLWQHCKCRALGVDYSARITVAYDKVGYRVD